MTRKLTDLGRYAADVKASSAEGLTLLNASSLQAKLGCFHSGNVASRTRSDDHQIVICEQMDLHLEHSASTLFDAEFEHAAVCRCRS